MIHLTQYNCPHMMAVMRTLFWSKCLINPRNRNVAKFPCFTQCLVKKIWCCSTSHCETFGVKMECDMLPVWRLGSRGGWIKWRLCWIMTDFKFCLCVYSRHSSVSLLANAHVNKLPEDNLKMGKNRPCGKASMIVNFAIMSTKKTVQPHSLTKSRSINWKRHNLIGLYFDWFVG